MIILLLTSMLSLYGSVNAAVIGPYTIHFSQFMDAAKYGVLYNSETIISVSLKECIEKCIATKQCRYINYHRTSKTCYFIGHDMVAADTLSTEKKAGYVFGRKSEWELQEFDQCNACEDKGECSAVDDQMCRDSGCGAPPIFTGTTVHGNMFTIGHKVLYECLHGYYVPSGNPVSTCLRNGSWSITQLNCGAFPRQLILFGFAGVNSLPIIDDCLTLDNVPSKNIMVYFVCSSEWFTIKESESCYKIIGPGNDMQASEKKCQSYNAHLITLETMDENIGIKAKLNGLPDKHHAYFTAYTDEEKEKTWMAFDSIMLGENDWGVGEPNGGESENCLVFWKSHDYKWADFSCNNADVKAICEISTI